MKEEILLRKLVGDGEGAGEEKKISQLAAFFRESRTFDDKKAAEASKALKALDAIEISIMKQNAIAAMVKLEADQFVEYATEIDNEIQKTQKKMDEAKEELSAARVVKKNRQEYSAVVKTIEEIPSRPDSIRRLSEVRDELERQHDRQRILEAKLNDRRNHLQAYNIILANLQKFVVDDDEIVESESIDDSSDVANECKSRDEPMETS